MNNPQPPTIAREVARRRCFAIISHPDAGKTTLTEKLLLYAGAIDLAGAVRRKAQQRHARSDWMEIEQARGISVTSTALQFEYGGCRFNLLDTPGHQDFSEDTYRVLTAVDTAVMVLDAARGVEPQTLKLFAVCRDRGVPVITFVNKLDQPGREPMELLDEIEKVLGMAAVPRNWPIGTGPEFQGVYDFDGAGVLRFERIARGERAVPVIPGTLDDERLRDALGDRLFTSLQDDAALLDGAGHQFRPDAFRAGRQTPVYFGSALNNFGVGEFLDALCDLALPPMPRASDRGVIDPSSDEFSGFVFKIQANMDPLHRDSMAFLRVVSGRFETGMTVEHPRLRRRLRLPRAHRIFARERETTEEAFPGDVVGLVNPGLFIIGDTVCEGAPLRFPPLPHFPPEQFARVRAKAVDKQKGFQKGLRQLEEEGAIQVLREAERRDPILAAVGELQFDLVQSRLSSEYGVETHLEPLPFRSALWLAGAEPDAEIAWPLRGVGRAHDREGRLVALIEGSWAEDLLRSKNPDRIFTHLATNAS
ncbi:MAG TPA: peptide chain release factor 3 [Thermoanaerobaculia bacterium]|nr:peptide chain release factor 3 [Thermoanaerobaculia bacterium]